MTAVALLRTGIRRNAICSASIGKEIRIPGTSGARGFGDVDSFFHRTWLTTTDFKHLDDLYWETNDLDERRLRSNSLWNSYTADVERSLTERCMAVDGFESSPWLA